MNLLDVYSDKKDSKEQSELDKKANAKLKPEGTKKLMNLVKTDCIKSIMKVEDGTIRFITDLDIKEINKQLEAKKLLQAGAQKLKDEDGAKLKREEKAKPQIVLKKGANFKKEPEIVKEEANEDRANGHNHNGPKADNNDNKPKDETVQKTQHLMDILRMMNNS